MTRLRSASGVGPRVAPWLIATALLSACAARPVPPDWQANAKAAMDDAMAAHLRGEQRLEDTAFTRAQSELARSGRLELMARAELMRCAVRVASLSFEPCDGFEQLRIDAAAAERAYADYLAGRPLAPEDVQRLPSAQQAVAARLNQERAPVQQLQDIEDPLSRLIAAAVLFHAGKADPGTITLAADTASAQGWRRPLLAWLQVQALYADKSGAADEAQRLWRRIERVSQGR